MLMNQWESRWQDGHIGFHLPEVNPILVQYSDELLFESPERVFVPFCGKSLDLCWLASKTNKVLGVELVGKAVQDFFAENNITNSIHQIDKFELFSSKSIDIFQGDFFELKLEQTSTFKAIYDRASIVSLQKAERNKYVDHLISFLEPGGRILLITLEYEQKRMDGPPYSVPSEEIEKLFTPYGTLELLESSEILDERFRNKGLDSLLEHVFMIIKK
ncbi:MAG: Thiopurine S-methyltransferase [Deltaproteobacteria bacterium]|nr:Thiopurine S-methyltransferase [Deltaproteobacteria bacterium]